MRIALFITCLADALKRGTGKSAYEEFGLGDFPAAGKTGTHYEFKDLWFVGYSSAVTCGVWCGFDQHKTIYDGAFSNRIALPVWVDVMNATVKDYKPEEFPAPQDVQVAGCAGNGTRSSRHRGAPQSFQQVSSQIEPCSRTSRCVPARTCRSSTFCVMTV